MDKKKLIFVLQSVLCIALAVALIAAALLVYTAGIRARAVDPDAWIYTREAVAARLWPAGILFVCAAAVAVWAHFAGVKAKDAPAQKGLVGRVQNRAAAPGDRIVKCVLLVLAICMIIAGILNGSMLDVLYKAVKICTECVGLG